MTRGWSSCREPVLEGCPLLRPSQLAPPGLDALQHSRCRCAPGATLWHEEEAATLITRATGPPPLGGLPHPDHPLPSPSPLHPFPRSRYLRQSGLASIPRAGRDSEKQDHRRRHLEAIPCAESRQTYGLIGERLSDASAHHLLCSFFFLAGYTLCLASRSRVLHVLLGNAFPPFYFFILLLPPERPLYGPRHSKTRRLIMRR